VVRGATFLLLGVLGACSGDNECRKVTPAFELDLSVDPSVAGIVVRLRVEIAVKSVRTASAVYDSPTSLFADGRTSLEVALGEAERGGFTVGIGAQAFSGSNALVALASASFAGSGDACNRFELALVDARVPIADGSRGDLLPRPPDMRVSEKRAPDLWKPCGGQYQTCCAYASCASGLVCSSGTCVHCGTVGAPCCASAPACVAGLVCASGKCRLPDLGGLEF
jgi:hypothetical protein